MQKYHGNKRMNREKNELERAMRSLPNIIATISSLPTSHNSAVGYLKDLFTSGMQLAKYREQLSKMKAVDDDAARVKAEAINSIDSALIHILDVAQKTLYAIQEDER